MPTREQNMDSDPKFTLFWRTGDREVVQGRTIAEAMSLAGYGGGAVRALDFYARGDSNEHVWDAGAREWRRAALTETSRHGSC